ncbi:type VI secretion system protein TssA [Cloacibacillus sp.]
MDISALGVLPISADSPAGIDAKYEPEYEALTEEIAKLSSVNRGKPISWQAVIDNASAILAGKSKDISVAAYMAVALQQTEGMQGLLDGLKLLRDLCANFWEEAFPPKAKLRRRINAYEWWHEQALELLKKEDQQPITAALSALVLQTAGELDELLGSLMEDAQPLRDMAEAVRAIPILPEKTQPEPEPEPQKSVTEERRETTTSETPRPAAQASLGQDAASLQSAFVDAARAYAFALRAEDPANYLAWQLPRAALWSRITALPPADGSGQTMIPPPDIDRIAAVERLLSGQNWLKAALAADDLFPSFPLYIDLQRMADEALAILGPVFSEARSRLRGETSAFLKRLPGLTALSYDGGVPFVSPQTRSWLEEIAAKGSSQNSPHGGTAGTGRTETAMAEARELLSGGDAAGALKRLEEAHGPSAVGNMRLCSEELRILCSQRETKTAAGLAKAMLQEIERDDLAKLEPDLAVEAMLAACRALDLAGDSAGAEQVREKLAGIRPSAVLGWN